MPNIKKMLKSSNVSNDFIDGLPDPPKTELNIPDPSLTTEKLSHIKEMIEEIEHNVEEIHEMANNALKDESCPSDTGPILDIRLLAFDVKFALSKNQRIINQIEENL